MIQNPKIKMLKNIFFSEQNNLELSKTKQTKLPMHFFPSGELMWVSGSGADFDICGLIRQQMRHAC